MSKPRVPAAVERATHRLFTEILTSLSRVLRDQNLTIAQVAVLHVLDLEPDVRSTSLVERLGLSASAVSRLVDDLVRRGLVERVDDPDDRRAKGLRVTTEGRDLVASISRARVEKIFETMTRSAPASVVRLVMAAMERSESGRKGP